MGNLTIDQILADRHRDANPEIYGIEKEASAQPTNSSPFSDEEIEKMASLLEDGKLPQPVIADSFNEKLAAALILQDSIHSLVKEASKVEIEIESDDSKGKEEEEKEEEENDDEEEVKEASAFVQKALESGHSEEDIMGFLEKKASVSPSAARKIMKGLMGTAAIGGSAYAGKAYGEEKTEEKAKNALKVIVPKVYMAGRQSGRRSGFSEGAYATNNAWQRRMQNGNKK